MEGQRAVGEAVVAGLALDETSMDDLDFTRAASYVMSPPIRSVEHQRALRSAVAGGVLHLIGTDHAVFNSTQKAAGVGDFRKIPNGVNGLEERLHVVWHTMVRLEVDALPTLLLLLLLSRLFGRGGHEVSPAHAKHDTLTCTRNAGQHRPDFVGVVRARDVDGGRQALQRVSAERRHPSRLRR